MSRRIRIIVAYDGTDFHGWQLQPALPTIQSVLEEIIEGIEGRLVRIEGSGRTDAGVHALAQVAAFTLENPIPCDNLRRAMNRLLPASVRVLKVEETHPDFHPRFDAIAKTYRYTIYRDEVCPPFDWRYVYHHPYPLDEEAMVRAASVYAGEHDFKAFAAADQRSPPASTVRTIFSSVMERRGSTMVYTVRGSGFLKHMVRNIVGTILEAGRGNISADVMPQKCGRTAPAKGLTLVSVEYPE
ncbi:MAG TPA: tRNA pseudouridine(38-40) synthase TruA [Bryobacteraceae bacterium]|nr:tRNA pseudouridine(38-40) synthase TruA [Bryobacteraceae bacterium]